MAIGERGENGGGEYGEHKKATIDHRAEVGFVADEIPVRGDGTRGEGLILEA